MDKLVFRKLASDITVFFVISSISVALIVWILQAVNLLDIISNKTVSFTLNQKYKIPKELESYNPVIKENSLTLNYDKKETNLKKIIDILNDNNILFEEINTNEGDLEDVFLKLVKKDLKN